MLEDGLGGVKFFIDWKVVCESLPIGVGSGKYFLVHSNTVLYCFVEGG